ncbi:MAG: hypothetical protein WCK49_06825 [Myxococcaceae bacterium]
MKSINLPFTKLLEFRCLDDGLAMTNEKGKPNLIQFLNSKNGDIVEAIALNLMNELGVRIGTYELNVL